MTRVAAVSLVLTLWACERPFVDQSEPNVVVVAPDLSEVQQQPSFALKLRAGSFRSIDNVSVNGAAMEFDATDRTWSVGLSVRRGVNMLILEAVDTEGVTSLDTVYALHLPSQYIGSGPPLPSGRGGHTTTLTPGGDMLVIGGAARAEGPAQSTLYVYSSSTGAFTGSANRLRTARTGHTSTLLADGRVLVVGGSRTDLVTSVSDLVERPEVYSPGTGEFEEWTVVGEPIRRTLHTAVYRRSNGQEFIHLYGGLGDTRYGGDPYLGVRQDLRTFRIAGNQLHEVNTLATAPYLSDPVYGHTTTRTQSGPFYVYGGRFESSFQQETSFSFRFDPLGDVRLGDIPALHAPRFRHAAAPLMGTLLFITGGRQQNPSDIVTTAEILSPASEAVFRVSRRPPIHLRYGHTATPTGPGQIFIVGGFGPDGTARTATEYFAVIPGGVSR